MESSVSIKDALEDVDKKLHASLRNDGNEVCIVIPRILLKDDAAVDQYLKAFDGLCQRSKANEPDTLKFGVFKSSQDNSLWALEHFTSEAALDVHRSSAQLKEMISWLQDDKPNGEQPLPMPVPLAWRPGSFTCSAMQQPDSIHMTVLVVETGKDGISRVHADPSHAKARLARFQQAGALMGLHGTTETQIWHLIGHRGKDSDGEAIRAFKEDLRAEYPGCDIQETHTELAVGFIGR